MEFAGLLDSWLVRTALALVLVYVCLRLLLLPPYRAKHTPEVANLPGPPPVPYFGWLIGNLAAIQDHQDTIMHPDWIKMGATGRCQHVVGQDTIWTFDPAAMGHIFQHSDVWERPSNVERILGRVTGNGLLTTKGADHRRQRRVVNPAFSTNAIKAMVPRMFEKMDECASLLGRCIDDDSLESFVSQHPAKDVDRVPGARKVDMLGVSAKLTQDVIGAVGFHTDFESLQPKENLLDSSISNMLNVIFNDAIIVNAQNLNWSLDKLPLRNRRAIKYCRGIMENLSARLMKERQAEMKAEAGLDEEKIPDMLDLLVQANGSERADQRLSDEELFAGSTTTAGTISSLLRRLALNPDFQRRLREEVIATGEEHPNFETLNSLPFLDNCVREILRLEPPATCTVRINNKDTVIPLSVPVRGRDGTMIEKALPVNKGSYVFLSMSTLQRQADIYGDDPEEFNPDRFNDASIPRANIPGMWGGLASFISGPHHCMYVSTSQNPSAAHADISGWRLALTEIKVVLFSLMRNFSFEELPSKPVIHTVMK